MRAGELPHAVRPAPQRRRRAPGEAVNLVSFEARYEDGTSTLHGPEQPAFLIRLKDSRQLDRFLASDLYSVALAFIRGEFDIQGDIVSAVRLKMDLARRGVRDVVASVAALVSPRRLESWIQSSSRAARNIRFHYDRSNDFYRSFLDTRMVYSCAYFKGGAAQTLDDAQLAKLDHVCRKLDLRPDDQFLDVGCGWGALVMRAAEHYGAVATGCTLSFRQDLYAGTLIEEKKLEHRVRILDSDYRDLRGQFHKIASVGMFEHVGRHRLGQYFRMIFSLLTDNGLFLNHGIVRPEGTVDGPETVFLRRKVFPGGELTTLSNVIREAGRAGFEVLDVENLRPHYALTCRRWVERLQHNAAECLKHVDRETYRTWLLYLAGSALSFEAGLTDVCQVLMAKRRPGSPRHLTRDYIYA